MAQGATAQRRTRTKVISRTGRYRRAVPFLPGDLSGEVALDATLRRAALRLAGEKATSATPPAWSIRGTDLCRKQRERACDHLIVLAVDSSDSMGEEAETRIKAAKGAVLALLRRAYQDRHQVALVAFGGEAARVVLPPTSSISLAQHRLERLPIGGATPLADGLFRAWQIIRLERRKHPGVRPILVLISDGEANVPLTPGAPVQAELLRLADQLRQDHLAMLLFDAVTDPRPPSPLRPLAAALGASYVKLTALKARHIVRAIREREQGCAPPHPEPHCDRLKL